MRSENELKTRGCDLYEGQEYHAVSQWEAILGDWAKFTGATYVSVTYMRRYTVVFVTLLQVAPVTEGDTDEEGEGSARKRRDILARRPSYRCVCLYNSCHAV